VDGVYKVNSLGNYLINLMYIMNEKDKRIDHGGGLIEYIIHRLDGELFQHYTKLNNKFHGEYKHYYRCKSFVHQIYVNGTQEGQYREYNPEGTLLEHKYYVRDHVEGEQLVYDYE